MNVIDTGGHKTNDIRIYELMDVNINVIGIVIYLGRGKRVYLRNDNDDNRKDYNVKNVSGKISDRMFVKVWSNGRFFQGQKAARDQRRLANLGLVN